ncbi:uncharacterized protein LOC119508831 [Choloepus didactylus]|uniref:uncharacterized protein LOC119508831 n=1 Tax=Choloepus didactylus TaxID=27675 RepID=UPI0018A01FAF|nr:uncharacterized protein LOC119508831 [Choloepus didactylus]
MLRIKTQEQRDEGEGKSEKRNPGKKKKGDKASKSQESGLRVRTILLSLPVDGPLEARLLSNLSSPDHDVTPLLPLKCERGLGAGTPASPWGRRPRSRKPETPKPREAPPRALRSVWSAETWDSEGDLKASEERRSIDEEAALQSPEVLGYHRHLLQYPHSLEGQTWVLKSTRREHQAGGCESNCKESQDNILIVPLMVSSHSALEDSGFHHHHPQPHLP